MNSIELLGFVLGVVGVYLTLKVNWLCFPIGIGNVIITGLLFFQQKLYADCLLQFVYLVLLVYGWIKWGIGNNEHQEKIALVQNKELFVGCILAITFAIVLGTYLRNNTDADVPYLDALITGFSLLAQWMIAKKYIENWVLWIVLNSISIGLFIYKDLWLYVVLYAIYLILAINGYWVWKKKLSSL